MIDYRCANGSSGSALRLALFVTAPEQRAITLLLLMTVPMNALLSSPVGARDVVVMLRRRAGAVSRRADAINRMFVCYVRIRKKCDMGTRHSSDAAPRAAPPYAARRYTFYASAAATCLFIRWRAARAEERGVRTPQRRVLREPTKVRTSTVVNIINYNLIPQALLKQ